MTPTTKHLDREPSDHAISNPDKRWARHAGDAVWHVTDEPITGAVPTRCNGRWPVEDDVERCAYPPGHERCECCQQSLVDENFGRLAAPANYDWPSAHQLDLGGESGGA